MVNKTSKIKWYYFERRIKLSTQVKIREKTKLVFWVIYVYRIVKSPKYVAQLFTLRQYHTSHIIWDQIVRLKEILVSKVLDRCFFIIMCTNQQMELVIQCISKNNLSKTKWILERHCEGKDKKVVLLSNKMRSCIFLQAHRMVVYLH